MVLDDNGMLNQYLTKLRVMIREDADILRELTEMLGDFAYSYNAQLQQAGCAPALQLFPCDAASPFQRVTLVPGESVVVEFDVSGDELGEGVDSFAVLLTDGVDVELYHEVVKSVVR